MCCRETDSLFAARPARVLGSACPSRLHATKSNNLLNPFLGPDTHVNEDTGLASSEMRSCKAAGMPPSCKGEAEAFLIVHSLLTAFLAQQWTTIGHVPVRVTPLQCCQTNRQPSFLYAAFQRIYYPREIHW